VHQSYYLQHVFEQIQQRDLSLQDELMVRFGSERLQKMMNRLGMDDSTPIESKMV
jgi:preprotein translocase subunit SecA